MQISTHSVDWLSRYLYDQREEKIGKSGELWSVVTGRVLVGSS